MDVREAAKKLELIAELDALDPLTPVRVVYLTYQVHNEAIVIPETIDCIRAMTGIETDGMASIAKTDRSLGITKTFLP